LESGLLVLAGFVVGMFGTIVGAGGGFLMLPIFLTVLHFRPAEAAGTTQMFVLANAVSGAIPYYLQGRVNVKAAIWFSAFAIPGSIAGALLSGVVPAKAFEQTFAVLLVAIAVRILYLLFFAAKPGEVEPAQRTPSIPATAAIASSIGLMAGLFGIGGGPLQVPMLLYLYRMPVAIATATSVFILAITAFAAGAIHFASGHVLVVPALTASLGGVLGGQAGAALSKRMKSKLVMVLFATAVLLTAGRLFIAA